MLSTKGFQDKDENSMTASKTTLNPNAAEFVPFSSKSSPGNAKNTKVSNLDVPVSSGKAVLDHSDSNASNNSDDEAHQYWRRQLPDDITPDFRFMGGDELQMVGGLSINDRTDDSQFDVLGTNHLSTKPDALSIHGVDDINLSQSMIYNGLGYNEDQSSVPFKSLSSSPWNKQFGNANLTNGREEIHHTGDFNAGFLNDLANEYSALNNASFSPLEFLSAEFPGFSVECIGEVYYRNGCDLNLTMEILSQLEVQVDDGFIQNLNSRTLSAPSLAALDFHALPVSKAQNGFVKYDEENVKQTSGTFQPIIDKGSFPFTTKHGTSGTPRDALNYASTVCKFASLDSGHWKYDINGSADMNVGSSRSLQSLSNSYNGHGKSMYTDKPQGNSTVRAAPIWLETGEAVGNIYSESRDEARDLAHVRNAFFEQAREAYLLGNKVLAKELSVKGQLFNMQMKATHEKARENIFRQRNSVPPEVQSYRPQGQDPLIDLHSLHVSEAIHVLKHELNILRRTARSAGQLLQVMVYVGTGHDTKGSNTPARLLVAVEQCLLDEGLQFSQPQPGLLRVVLF